MFRYLMEFWKSKVNIEEEGKIIDGLRRAANKLRKDNHEKIAIRVFRRLRLRHSQLCVGEDEARSYKVSQELDVVNNHYLDDVGGNTDINSATQNNQIKKNEHNSQQDNQDKTVPKTEDGIKENGRFSDKHRRLPVSQAQRAYHLAVTDLFVEKALDYLELQARPYWWLGIVSNTIAVGVVTFGAYLAVHQMGFLDVQDIPYNVDISWQYLTLAFTRAFTAYGMIVLISVGLWRFGRAMLDQSERLMERRHALRQGRLFVHLNDGHLSIDDLDKAFNWNSSLANAFGGMPTDAQAPWGVVVKQMAQTTPEIVKAVNAHMAASGSDRKDKKKLKSSVSESK